MANDRLIYMPLGGAGEIGMNMYVYGYGPRGRESLIVIDAGITFPNPDTMPGVDLIVPDFSWLAERRDRIAGCFLSHAHEDHIGAIGFFCRAARVPVFARQFTQAASRRKIEELGVGTELLRRARPYPEHGQAGPFRVTFVPISHSIPESSALVLECAGGRILHTGDFKIDSSPVVGASFDENLLKAACGEGVSALVCDSTNIFSLREGRSESSVGPELVRLFKSQKGAVAATTFASNIARVKQLAEAGVASGRSIVLLGRAMNRMIALALDNGMIGDFPDVVEPDRARDIPRRHLLLLATGSQGEHRSATSQLSNGKFRGLRLVEGDTFLFSSKTIPGNELPVIRTINKLSEMGVRVIDDSAGIYHVSGHANRPDLARLYDLVKPQLVVPMHGENRHLSAHVAYAKSKGFSSLLIKNGMMLDIGNRQILDRESVDTGYFCLDGQALVPGSNGVLRSRLKMAREGQVSVSIVLRGRSLARRHIRVTVQGVVEDHETGWEQPISAAVAREVEESISSTLDDDNGVERLIQRTVRKTMQLRAGKTPVVSVMIHRI